MRTYLKSLAVLVLVVGWFSYATLAAADIVADPLSSPEGVSAADLPLADLAGWFLTFDPSNEWTSESNIETMEAWLVIAEEIAANPSLLQQFYGWGMMDSLPPPVWQWLVTGAETPPLETGTTPEPATLELLGVALAVFAVVALAGVRRTKQRFGLCRATKD